MHKTHLGLYATIVYFVYLDQKGLLLDCKPVSYKYTIKKVIVYLKCKALVTSILYCLFKTKPLITKLLSYFLYKSSELLEKLVYLGYGKEINN